MYLEDNLLKFTHYLFCRCIEDKKRDAFVDELWESARRLIKVLIVVYVFVFGFAV